MKVIYSKPPGAALKISRKKFNALLERTAVLIKLNAEPNQKISVAFVTLSKIAKINKNYVGHSGITDVISFDYRDADNLRDSHAVIAELIVSYEKASAEAEKRKNTSFTEELALYLVHGMLHIVGFNDLDSHDRKKMRRKEWAVLSVLKQEFNLLEIFSLQL